MNISDVAGVFSVDIATRVINPDEDIYIIQPGRSYWMYELFRDTEHVFLDFPGLTLSFEAPAPKDRQLRQMIVRSMDVGAYIDAGRQGKKPSDNIADYEGLDARKRLGRYVGAVKRLYWDLKPGAIVVVPGPHYYDDVLIGEIVGPPVMVKNAKLYDNEPVPARKVRWLRNKPRAAFTPAVRERFGTPNPIMQLDRSLRLEVLRAGFDQYAFAGEYTARLNTTKADFTTLDDYRIQTFVNYVSGVLIALELGMAKELTFEEAIALLEKYPDRAAELKLNINSKGFQRLVDATVKPIVIGALYAAATAMAVPAGAAHAAQPAVVTAPQTVNVTNSVAGKDDPCTIEVAARVEGAMKLMKLDEWKRVCENAAAAKRSTGLSTTMRVRHREGRAKP